MEAQKKNCPACKGSGEIERNIQREGFPEMDVPTVCEDCAGTGRELGFYMVKIAGFGWEPAEWKPQNAGRGMVYDNWRMMDEERRGLDDTDILEIDETRIKSPDEPSDGTRYIIEQVGEIVIPPAEIMQKAAAIDKLEKVIKHFSHKYNPVQPFEIWKHNSNVFFEIEHVFYGQGKTVTEAIEKAFSNLHL